MRLVLFGCGCPLVQGEPNTHSLTIGALTLVLDSGVRECSKGKGDEGRKRATQLLEGEL